MKEELVYVAKPTFRLSLAFANTLESTNKNTLLACAILTLVACTTSAAQSNPVSEKESTVESPANVLHRMSEEHVSADSLFLGKPRFVVNLDEKKYSYDLSPISPAYVLSPSDPYAVPLEALIRAEVLRRDFQAAVPQETFWEQPMELIEASIDQCIQRVEKGLIAKNATRAQTACSDMIQPHFNELEDSIRDYARKHQLEFVQEAQTARSIGYRIKVIIAPPRARIRIMTELEYKKCVYFKTSLEDQWNDLLEGETSLIGRYHYLAEWPADLNGPEEGAFVIKNSSDITFRPKP